MSIKRMIDYAKAVRDSLLALPWLTPLQRERVERSTTAPVLRKAAVSIVWEIIENDDITGAERRKMLEEYHAAYPMILLEIF